MAKLTAKARKRLPSDEFAGPHKSYPVPDKSHARNALARASEMYARGKLSAEEYSAIRPKANAKLGKRK